MVKLLWLVGNYCQLYCKAGLLQYCYFRRQQHTVRAHVILTPPKWLGHHLTTALLTNVELHTQTVLEECFVQDAFAN